MKTMPKLLVFAPRSKPYPRNDVLVRAFCENFTVTTTTIEETAFGKLSFFVQLLANGWRYDVILLLHPGVRFAVPLFFAQPFVRAKLIGDAFISEYDTLVSDRKLASQNSLKAIYYRALDRLFVWSCDVLLFDTPEHREYFERTCSIRPKTRTVIAPISIDIEVFQKILPQFPEGIAKKANEKIVIFFGNYIPLQGAEYVVDAIETLKEKKDLRFFMVGNGQTKPSIVLRAKAKGLENVTFIERMDHQALMAFVKTADLALGIFGDSEKAKRVIPNKVLEAMALGVPVVTGRNAPSERYFKEGEHVRYARLADGKDIARAIEETLSLPEESQKMGERGRQEIKRHFSLHSLAASAVKEVVGIVLNEKARSLKTANMRIALLAPHIRVSGGLRIILGYASLLALRGHDVRVYVQSSHTFRRTIANMLRLGYPKWMLDFRARIVRVSQLTPERMAESDVLIATTHQTALALADFPKHAGRQFYLLQHDEGLYHGDRALVDRAYRLPQKKIVVATWLKELLKEKYGQDSTLLTNPVDRKLFHPVLWERHDGIRILLLDHTYEWKGTKEGVRIVSELKQKYPEIRLIGFGARREHSEYQFDEYHYNLPQEKLAQLYSNCDIFLCPSWDEGFGLPSLEAMACKVAVVTYDNGGSRDFATHEKTALVAPHRDEGWLKEELERLVKDKILRERIAQGGYEFVLTMPTWEDQTTRLEQMLNSK